jgi:hypothetical protein
LYKKYSKDPTPLNENDIPEDTQFTIHDGNGYKDIHFPDILPGISTRASVVSKLKAISDFYDTNEKLSRISGRNGGYKKRKTIKRLQKSKTKRNTKKNAKKITKRRFKQSTKAKTPRKK